MMYYILSYILFHIICGILSAGFLMSDLNKTFPLSAKEEYRHNLGFSFGISLFGGPITLLIAILHTGFAEHGWTLRRPK